MYLNSRNNPHDTTIVTGSVRIHADSIVFIVFVFKLFTPFEATIDPAIPELSMCVVDTGSLSTVDSPIVIAATNSEEAPCA